MKFKLLDRRGVLVGVVAAALAFLATLMAITMLYWFLRPFVWAAVYKVPYSPPPGPYSPDSGEWLFAHAIYFFSAISAGYAGAKWAGRSGCWLILILAVAWLLLAASGIPETSLMRQAIYVLGIPLGILCGGLMLRRRRFRALEAAA